MKPELKEKLLRQSEFGGINEWEFSEILSTHFNQLKAKLFNLIEGAIGNEKQQEALKGLIKGFCNDQFKICNSDLKWFMEKLGHLKDSEIKISPEIE